jgi:hypothetical protein
MCDLSDSKLDQYDCELHRGRIGLSECNFSMNIFATEMLSFYLMLCYDMI